MPILKVWTCKRNKRTAIAVVNVDIRHVLSTANKKLGVNGISIVLEKDGTVIDESDILQEYSQEILIILQNGETWQQNCQVLTSENSNTQPNAVDISAEIISNDNVSNTKSVPAVENKDNQENAVDNAQSKEDTETPLDTQEKTIASILKDRLFSDWEGYKILWITIDSNTLKELQGDKEIDKSLKQQLITRIVDDMRGFDKHLPRKAFQKVAAELRDHYPKSFEEKLRNGQRCGQGFENTVRKMMNYNNNSNRPHRLDNLNQKLKVPINQRKSLSCIQAGCSQWQPDHLPENEDETTQEEKRVWLLSYNLYDQTDPPMLEVIKENFCNSCVTQRLFLNDISKENHLLPQVREVWPCLTNKPFIFWHYEKLTGHTIHEIAVNIKDDVPRILSYGIMKRLTDINFTDTSEENQFFEALQIVCKHFKEQLDTLIIRFPAGTESFETGQNPDPQLCIIDNDPTEYIIVLKILLSIQVTTLKLCNF
ncbi:uncharacterized protein LOC107981207 [Nasonia vitripennis]|uniref:CIDE-N domain-containing protein n=1 Tax=Nasonia vitripennis TaxID=7425 RepID=A0A7M7TA02_NASVI|nr:uncharacterized protein LOC107981207 [Nasonia vitripennis]XP_031785955.1 uncharacterized protein LOC107981207 [Nasonia vitripennis]